jgi:hypothetical protein
MYTEMDLAERAVFAIMAIRILIDNSCTRWHGTFKGLSQDEG